MLAGDHRAAIAQYEALLRNNDPILRDNLAVLYQRTGRALSTAHLAVAPEAATVLDTPGWLPVGQNPTAKRLELLRKALDNVPDAYAPATTMPSPSHKTANATRPGRP